MESVCLLLVVVAVVLMVVLVVAKVVVVAAVVSVSAEILGFSGTDTQDVSGVQVDFVSVSDLMVADQEIDDALIGVNIVDLRIE